MLIEVDNAPSWLRSILSGTGLTIVAAYFGRMMWHVNMVRLGHRRFFSRYLIFELFIAIGMGLIGDGIAEYLEVRGKVATAIVVTIAYLGPRGIEVLLAIYAKRKFGDDPHPR